MSVSAVVEDNPVRLEGAETKAGATYGDVETALGGLQDGSVAAEEVMRTLDSYIDNKLSLSSSMMSAANSIVARLGEAPANWQ